ncbi:MAG: hypothetical protein J5570_03435 [Lachnospiraceae bacterium]|nr:hypothetical protein [Lachnospiraceae bacterium]
MRNKNYRYLPLILSAVLFLLLSFSAFYIAEESVHECSGEECPICECLQICEGILYETQGARLIIISALIAYVFIFSIGTVNGRLCSFDTLVSEKVRMDS